MRFSTGKEHRQCVTVGFSSGLSMGDDRIKINSSKFNDLLRSIFHSSLISVLHRVIFLFV